MNEHNTRTIHKAVKSIFHSRINELGSTTCVDYANSLETISGDIYSSETRFIYELIQNADDAASDTGVEIDIQVIDKYLVVAHNGALFSERDVQGLCSVNHGTKKSRNNAIGYKGIGFKSVFTQGAANVYVLTGEEVFQFNKQHAVSVAWQESWGDKNEWESTQGREFKAPWQVLPLVCETLPAALSALDLSNKVATIIELDDPKQIADDIASLFEHMEFLLFLSKTNSITVSLGNDVRNVYSKAVREDGTVELQKNKKPESLWWLFSKTEQVGFELRKALADEILTPEKLKEANSIGLTLAFRLRLESGVYSIVPLKNNESRLFTYLPTEVTEFGFPFLVNSNFFVDASREKIKKDHIWNAWLFERIGSAMIESANAVTKQSFDIRSNLTGLRKAENYGSGASLRQCFNSGLNVALKTIPFIRNKNNDLIKLSEVLLDESGVVQLETIDLDAFESHIKGLGKTYSKLNVLDEPTTEGSNILRQLGAERFTKEDLLHFIGSKSFLRSIDTSTNFEVLKLVAKHASSARGSSNWNTTLSQTPLLTTSDDQFLPIKQVCEPISGDTSTLVDGLSLIESALYDMLTSDEELYRWLKGQGLAEPSSTAILETKILPNVSTYVNENNHIEVFNYLFGLHRREELTDQHYKDLRSICFLTTDNEFRTVSECALSDAYEPSIQPRKFGENIPLVSQVYLSEASNVLFCKEFLVKCGVSDSFNLDIYSWDSNRVNSNFLSSVLQEASRTHSYPHLVSLNRAEKVDLITLNYLIPGNDEHITEYWRQIFSTTNVSYLGQDTGHAPTVSNDYDSKRFETSVVAEKFSFDGVDILALDAVDWGKIVTNRVSIPSYFRWFLKSQPVIPSLFHGLKEGQTLLINNEENLYLAKSIIPVISSNEEISDGWARYLGLKQEFELIDFFVLLKSLPDQGLVEEGLTAYVTQLYCAIKETLNKIEDWKNEVSHLSGEEGPIPLLTLSGVFVPEPVCVVDNCDIFSSSSSDLLYSPSECVENERFRYFLSEVLNVKFADETNLVLENDSIDSVIKSKLLRNLPYLFAYNENYLSDGELDLVWDRLEELKICNCASVEKEYLLKGQSVYSNAYEVLFYEDAIYYSTNLNSVTSSKFSSPLACALGLEKEVSSIHSALLSTEADLSELNLPPDSTEWLDNLQQSAKYESLCHCLIVDTEIEDLDGDIPNLPSEPEQHLPRENQVVTSQQSVLSAISYLENKGLDLDTSEEAVKEFINSRKIKLLHGRVLHVRSAKRGYLNVNYTVWHSLLDSKVELMVFLPGSREPKTFTDQQSLIDACVGERVKIEIKHGGAAQQIEQMFDGDFRGQSYSDIPSTNLVFKLAEVESDSSFETIDQKTKQEESSDNELC